MSRLQLAAKADVSLSWLGTLEAGLQPTGSQALVRVEKALIRLEAEFNLEPGAAAGLGQSGYRGDTTRPEAA